MKKVLIPTDFSDNAWDALTYTIRLYDDIPCRIYILNTYQVSTSRLANMRHQGRGTKLFEILKEESLNGLEKISDHLEEYLLNDKHEYVTRSESGDLITIMNQLVSVENVDIIVMGTTGATGAKEIFMGSNAVRAIKHIDLCPIISVPKKYEYKELEQVAFATDFKRSFSVIELNALLELQLLNNFDVHIIHVKKEEELSDLQKQNMKALENILDNVFIETISNGRSVSKTINNYTDKNDINMICLMNYEHSFIEKLIHEPIVKKISFHSQVPLLTISV